VIEEAAVIDKGGEAESDRDDDQPGGLKEPDAQVGGQLPEGEQVKIIQGNKGDDYAEEADEPPAIDDALAFDEQDEEIIEGGDGKQSDHEAGSGQPAISRGDGHNGKRGKKQDRDQVEKMEKRPDIQEVDQLAFADILSEIGLDREDGQFLEGEPDDQVKGEIVSYEAAEDLDDVLVREHLLKKGPQKESECQGAAQEVEEDEADKDLGGKVLAGVTASPEGFPLMR